MVHWYVEDNGHVLTIKVNFMVKCICVCYMSLKSNGYFVTSATMFDWLVIIGLISLGPPKVKHCRAASDGH